MAASLLRSRALSHGCRLSKSGNPAIDFQIAALGRWSRGEVLSANNRSLKLAYPVYTHTH